MIRYFCDGPGCVAHPLGAHARATALSVPGIRERTNGEAPVVYLPPAGWDEVVRRDGTRHQVCSTTCRAALLGRIGRDPTGGPRDCPTCGTRLTGPADEPHERVRVTDEHGSLWYLCCGIKWSPTTYRIPGAGYGASLGVPHQCGICCKQLPADFLAHAVLVHLEHLREDQAVFLVKALDMSIPTEQKK